MTDHPDQLVKVAYAGDEAEAELLQGLLRLGEVGSVVRRAPGFDAPEFGAAGARHVLVAASDVPAARDLLREVDAGEREVDTTVSQPRSRSGGDRLRAASLLGVALVVGVICVAADVFP